MKRLHSQPNDLLVIDPLSRMQAGMQMLRPHGLIWKNTWMSAPEVLARTSHARIFAPDEGDDDSHTAGEYDDDAKAAEDSEDAESN